MTSRQNNSITALKKEIKNLKKELATTRAALEAILGGKIDAIIGPECPYVLKAKQAEEEINKLLKEKDALIKEIHHRVKNNLQIVVSLLHLQLAHTTNPESRDNLLTLQNRIRAMALVHDMFYRTENMAYLNLADYLERIAIHLFNVYRVDENRIKLNLELQPVEVSINIAIPIGMILNELVSNSLKHAFKNKDTGEVRLMLSSDNGTSCRLIVQDDGIGLPPGISLNQPNTLGLEIVRLLTEQINGTIKKLDIPGTAFELKFNKFLQ